MAIDDKLAVLCDGDKRLTVVGISAEGEKALAQSAAALTKSAIVSPIAVLDKVVFVVVRDEADATDRLLGFVLPDLAPGKSQVLDGPCVWGPRRVGKLVLASTAKGTLWAIDGRQQVVWQAALEYGPLAGVPCAVGDAIYLSARGGMVWRISAIDGKELGKVDAGCPLGTGPVVMGQRLVVGGHDGSLLEIRKP